MTFRKQRKQEKINVTILLKDKEKINKKLQNRDMQTNEEHSDGKLNTVSPLLHCNRGTSGERQMMKKVCFTCLGSRTPAHEAVTQPGAHHDWKRD